MNTNVSEPNAGFLTWLASHRGEDTRLGDLANDFACDRDAPHAESLDDLLNYLGTRGACSECLRSAKSAWGWWRRCN